MNDKEIKDSIRPTETDFVNYEQLKAYADVLQEYLDSSEAYLNPDLTLYEVAEATSISTKNLSKAINTVLGMNFFRLINGKRVEKSKILLINKKENNQTIDAIATQCGFNSRFSLNNAFKNSIGMTTSQWLKSKKA